ncbi:MAG: HEAT repeat domain-containing protein, partial [Spirochaetota bacterium]|nr:HEAT repeat domain-containing protein [Spirochaetota bacterium]
PIPAKSSASDSIEKYKEILEFGTSGKRIWVISEIEKSKNKAYSPLLKDILLKEKNDEVLIKTVVCINNLKVKEHAPLVARLVDSQNKHLKVAAISSLGILEHYMSKDKLLSILKNESDPYIIEACVMSLGKLKSQKSLPQLYALYDKSKTKIDTKHAIITALGDIGNTSSIPFLEKILDNPGSARSLRVYSAGSLGKIGGPKAVSILNKHVHDKDPVLVRAVIDAMGHSSSQKSYTTIIQSLKHDDPMVRLSALKALEKQKDPRAFRILKYMIHNDENYKVRQKAVHVMTQIGGLKATKMWREELKSDKTNLKATIISSLHTLKGNEARDLLLLSFKRERNVHVRKTVLKKLFEVDKNEAAKLVENNVMKLDDREYLGLKLYAVMLLFQNMGESRIQELDKYTAHQNKHVRRYTLFYLLGTEKETARNLVYQALQKEKNDDVILYTLDIFRKRKMTSCIPLLKDHLSKSRSLRVRKEALSIGKYLEGLK